MMMTLPMNRATFAAGLLVVAACAAAPARSGSSSGPDTTVPVGPLTLGACPAAPPSPDGARCGLLRVPESWQRDSSRWIELSRSGASRRRTTPRAEEIHFDPERGIALKRIEPSPDGAGPGETSVARKIQLGDQPPSLFSVTAGYRKMSSEEF